jgi:tight adherence protein C
MADVPAFVFVGVGAGVFTLAVFGLRGLADIHAALRAGELTRLDAPRHWRATRAFCGFVCCAPVYAVTASLGGAGFLAALAVAGVGYAVAPQFLASARRRIEHELLDELPLHLDLLALALENGSSLPSAFASCAERAPESVLRRAWARVIAETASGVDPLEALRGLEQRLSLAPMTSLLQALRAAQRLGMDFAPVLRDKARQCAAQRFARAEYLARAAPLKLWAALLLCLAPCTVVVLAYPAARMLAIALGE